MRQAFGGEQMESLSPTISEDIGIWNIASNPLSDHSSFRRMEAEAGQSKLLIGLR